MATMRVTRGTVINGAAYDVGDIVEDVPEALAKWLEGRAKAVRVDATEGAEGVEEASEKPADAPVETATAKPQRKRGTAGGASGASGSEAK